MNRLYPIFFLTVFYLFSAGVIAAEQSTPSSFSLEEALLGHWVAQVKGKSNKTINLHYYFDRTQCSIMSEELVKDGEKTNTKVRLIHFGCRKIDSSGDVMIIKTCQKGRRGYYHRKKLNREYAYRLTFSPDRDKVTHESIKYRWKHYLTYLDDKTAPPIDNDQIIEGKLINIDRVIEEEEIIEESKKEIKNRNDIEDRSHLSARQALLGHWQTPSRGFDLYFQKDVVYRVSPDIPLSTPAPVDFPTQSSAGDSLLITSELRGIRKDSLERNISANGYNIFYTGKNILKYRHELHVIYDPQSKRLKKFDIGYDRESALDDDLDRLTIHTFTFSEDKSSFTWEVEADRLKSIRHRGKRIKLGQFEPIKFFYVDNQQKPDKH